MRITIWSLDLAIHEFTFFKYSFWSKSKLLKVVSCLLAFVMRENKTFISVIHDSLFLPFVNHAPPPQLSLYDIPSQYVVSQVTGNFCLHYIILFLNYIDNLIENQNVTAFSLASDKTGTGTCKLALTLFYAIATILYLNCPLGSTSLTGYSRRPAFFIHLYIYLFSQ